MAVRMPFHENNGLFFISFTCCDWIDLFALTNSYDVVYKWFDFLKSNGHFITGYVVMPNHLHVLVAIRCSPTPIPTIVSNGKRFMAYEIVARLKNQDQKETLDKLCSAVSAPDKRRGKLHRVFQPSFDCKECYSEKFIEIKLEYIHQNPCAGKWNLATSPIEYEHSSARFYETGEPGVYEVTNYKELLDIDLTK